MFQIWVPTEFHGEEISGSVHLSTCFLILFHWFKINFGFWVNMANFIYTCLSWGILTSLRTLLMHSLLIGLCRFWASTVRVKIGCCWFCKREVHRVKIIVLITYKFIYRANKMHSILIKFYLVLLLLYILFLVVAPGCLSVTFVLAIWYPICTTYGVHMWHFW